MMKGCKIKKTRFAKFKGMTRIILQKVVPFQSEPHVATLCALILPTDQLCLWGLQHRGKSEGVVLLGINLCDLREACLLQCLRVEHQERIEYSPFPLFLTYFYLLEVLLTKYGH